MKFSVYRLAAWYGARLMDRAEPDWPYRIRPWSLDVSSGLSCVLGQVFGTYYRGRKALGIRTFRASLAGFLILPPFTISYRRLTDAWLVEVSKRRPAPVVTRVIMTRKSRGLAA